MLVVEDEVRLSPTSRGKKLRTRASRSTSCTVGRRIWQAGAVALRSVDIDILLPGLNGYRSAGSWRRRQPGHVLMLTAKQGEHDEAEALELGADSD